MAQSAPTAPDDARRVFSGSLTAAGQRSAAFQLGGDWNLTLFGDFVGQGRLDRSFDGGTTWVPCTNAGAVVLFTAPSSEIVTEPEPSVLYSVFFVARTSGTLSWRASQ